jgi:hypothetical protein
MVMVFRKQVKKMKSRENKKIITQLSLEMETADRLNNMVIDVLEEWFTPTEFEIFRYNPICWRVKERQSTKTIIAVVLQDLNDGNFAFTVGGDWPYRPTTQDTTKESLLEVLERIFPP